MLYNGTKTKKRVNHADWVNCVTGDVTAKDIDPLGMRTGPFFIHSPPSLPLLLLLLCH